MNLEAAIEAKDVESVKSLLASGADANAADEQGQPLLIRAIMLGQTEIAELLISRGADVNAKNRADNGSTPLHWAAGGGMSAPNATMVKLLLARAAHVDAKTGAGNTPLMWAARDKAKSALDVAELLLAHGADLNCQGFDGIPLQYAKDEGTHEMVEMLRSRRKAALPGNRNLGQPKDWLTKVLQFLGCAPPTPCCPKCKSTDVEQTEILAKREEWECNTCKEIWSIWYPPYQHRNKRR